MMTFSEKIKSLRKKKKISQDQTADKIGISRPSYIAVENGTKELTLTQTRQLAVFFGVSLDELIFDTVQVSSDDYKYNKYKQIILNCLKFGGAKNDGKITKTKLAKLAYLVDFAWFYKKLEPMSGLSYRRIPQGPVPDQYFRVIDDLYESEAINIETKGKAMLIQPNEEVSNDELSNEEVQLIKKVCLKWREADTEKIVNFTHNQLPWKLCRAGELIPYELITQEEPANVF